MTMTCKSANVKKAFLLSILFLLQFAVTPLFSANALDGTFRLRALKDEIDRQFAASHYGSLRQSLKGSLQSREMVEGQTEIGFQVFNFAAGLYEYRRGRLMATGKHCYLFVESDRINSVAENSSQSFAQIAAHFDQSVYPTVEKWFGKPVVPAEFGLEDDRVFIFLVDINDSFSDGYVAGYFDHRDIEGLWGNQKPVFFMDIDPGVVGDSSDKRNPFYRTLAHELQHMVNFSIRHAAGHPVQERWLDEGFAMFSEYVYSGKVGADASRLPPSPHLARFLEKPALNLISNSNVSWFHEDHLFRQYGASFLFVTYLVEKLGGETESMQQSFMREFIRTKNAGVAGINEMFNHLALGFAEIFSNFTLALYIDDPAAAGGAWGFINKSLSFPDEAAQLPLKMVRHNTSGGTDSYMGSNGSVMPNSVAIEEIAVPGNFSVELKCDNQIRPAVAQLLPDGTGKLLFLESTDKPQTLSGDLSDGRRFFILPLAFKELPGISETYDYSFRSKLNKILIYPLPHPVFPDQFMIFLRSFAGPLKPPPVLRVSFGNIIDSPKLHAADETDQLFLTHYKIPGSGHGQAFCHYDDFSCSFSFSAATGTSEKVQTLDSGTARLSFSDTSGAVAAIVQTEILDTSLPEGTISGPHDILLGENASATLAVKHDDAARIGLVSLNDSGKPFAWIPAALRGNEIVAPLKSGGRYYFILDSRPPVLKDLKASIAANFETFLTFVVEDDVSGVDLDAVEVFLDNNPLQPVSVADGHINLGRLLPGEQNVTLKITDNAGNQVSASLRAAAGDADSIIVESFPNPATMRCFFRLSLAAPTAFNSATVKIFDTAGTEIRTLPLQPISAKALQAEWDLKNGHGKQVANGVYFYKARFADSNGARSKKGKISVLR